MIQQGELLAGKYRVEQVLGAGGMGYVVAALHEQLGQRVAVKLLVPELCENEDSVTRFLREARAAVRIQSEHVARVLDVGELTNGSPYMVMEFLNGRDLADELDQPGEVLPVEVAIDYVLQASEAVAEAHSIGVIHRDLKPANLFLTHRPDGSPLVKVLDFGISKAINTEDSALEPAPSLTATHSLLGSPAYMSPEQIRRPKHVDTRTDIWSLGSILYELLAKDPPFVADSPLALLAAVVSDPLPSVREKRPDVSADLEAVIAKCLEKNPDNRYQTVAELADALAPFAPRSQPSVSRISGILRATSLRPAPTDKSPSSDRTLQSPGTPISEQPTEELKVKVITPAPAARSEKNTKTDWEATPSMVASRRRTVVMAAALLAAAAAGVALWVQRPAAPIEATPDPSTVKVSTGSAAGQPSAQGAPTASAAAEAPAAASVNAAPSASAAAQVSAAASTSAAPSEAANAKLRAKAPGKAPVAPPAATPAPAPAPTPAPPKAAIADPLDGRR
jgi:serine/threonine-protein kinase